MDSRRLFHSPVALGMKRFLEECCSVVRKCNGIGVAESKSCAVMSSLWYDVSYILWYVSVSGLIVYSNRMSRCFVRLASKVSQPNSVRSLL